MYQLVGGRKIEHLHDNIKALTISLTPEQIKALEEVVPLDPGFPKGFVPGNPAVSGVPLNFLMNMIAQYEFVKAEEAIKPVEKK